MAHMNLNSLDVVCRNLNHYVFLLIVIIIMYYIKEANILSKNLVTIWELIILELPRAKKKSGGEK